MALFKFRWLRRMVRRHTNPIPENSARVWKQRLSLGYAFLAWNAFGFIVWQMFKGKNDWASKLTSFLKITEYSSISSHSSLSWTSQRRRNRLTAICKNVRHRKGQSSSNQLWIYHGRI